MNFVIAIALFLVLHPVSALSDPVGQPASSFSLKDLSGRTVTLADFRGKVVFLDFWAAWCRSCREELVDLDRMYTHYGDQGFIVIGISVEDSPARVAAFLRKTPVAFPVLLDGNGVVADAYRFSGLPSGFLIDRNGDIRGRFRGIAGNALPQFEKEIAELLKQ